MKDLAKKLVYLAAAVFILAVVFKLGGIAVGAVFASTLLKLTQVILLFAIALALV